MCPYLRKGLGELLFTGQTKAWVNYRANTNVYFKKHPLIRQEMQDILHQYCYLLVDMYEYEMYTNITVLFVKLKCWTHVGIAKSQVVWPCDHMANFAKRPSLLAFLCGGQH